MVAQKVLGILFMYWIGWFIQHKASRLRTLHEQPHLWWVLSGKPREDKKAAVPGLIVQMGAVGQTVGLIIATLGVGYSTLETNNLFYLSIIVATSLAAVAAYLFGGN